MRPLWLNGRSRRRRSRVWDDSVLIDSGGFSRPTTTTFNLSMDHLTGHLIDNMTGHLINNLYGHLILILIWIWIDDQLNAPAIILNFLIVLIISLGNY